MKRYILTIIIAAYGVCCHALPAEPDSLSRGRSYYDMAEEVLSMERYDYDGVLKLGHAAYSLLLEDKDLKGASDVMVLMSDVYESHADIDSVMICLDMAEAVLPPDMEEERLDIICRKKYWARKYDIQSLVLKLREQIRSVSESSDNPSVLISSYFDMAEDAAADKQISRAEALYLKAVELAGKIHDTGLEYAIYGELYLMENSACQYGKALEYAMKALALSRKLDVPPGLDCYTVSNCLYNLGQTERARVYADSLLMIPADYVMNEGRLYQYSGALELLHGRPEKALSLLAKADSCMSVAVPQKNPERVQILAQVGKALRLSGRMEESAQAYAAYSDYRCRLYGRESRYGFKGLRLHAEAEMLAGHYSVAEKLYSDISEVMISRIKARMPYLTSEERPGYLSDMQDVAAQDTMWLKTEYVPVTSFIHTLRFDTYRRIYQAYDTPENFYAQTFDGVGPCGGDSIFDKTKHLRLQNTFAISLLEGFNKWAKAGLKAFITSDLRHFTLPDRMGWCRQASVLSRQHVHRLVDRYMFYC